MTKKVFRIERADPRPGGAERPYFSKKRKAYRLADPKHGAKKHHARHAHFEADIDVVAEKVEGGFHLWMTRTGKWPSLISPESLRIIYA